MESKKLEGIKTSEINNEKYLVAFLDIIGFKKCVEKSFNGDSNIYYKIKSILDSLRKDLFEVILEPINISYKQFSDCITISMPYPENDNKEFISSLMLFITAVRDFQLSLLLERVYVRGGISAGKHLEDDNIIFSKGLINAYKLESERALYPRIIIDNLLFDNIKNAFYDQKDNKIDKPLSNAFVVDWDGIVFLNPFNLSQSLNEDHLKKNAPTDLKELIQHDNEDLSNICEDVKKKIKKFKKPNKKGIIEYNILQKYLWLFEFIKWNLEESEWNHDESPSKIRFEYFL